ncbi:MAG TPA: hypothetical protein VGI43_01645 [Mucilaginibacter sp.]
MEKISEFINRNEIKISRVGMIAIFLALIRSISEPLHQPMSQGRLKLFLIGSIIAAASCLLMTILGFYSNIKE